MFKDYFGKELKIGDTVVFTSVHLGFHTSKVLKFGKKTVILEEKPWSKHSWRYSKDLIKIEE